MVALDFVLEFMMTNFSDVTVSRNNTHFHARCALCGDSKKSKQKKRFHLTYYNDEKIVYHCFNCNETGNFIQLYARLNGISYKEARDAISSYDKRAEHVKKKIKEKPKKEEKKVSVVSNLDGILLDCLAINSSTDSMVQRLSLDKLIDFKERRKIPDQFPLYVAYRGKYKGRVIIPVIKNNSIVYFQGRALSNSLEPKYLNPTVEKESIIFNEECFDPNKYIIVTEGILDAMALGTQGTACLGSHITDEFLSRLFTLTKMGVIIALDNDVTGMMSTFNLITNSKFANKLRYFKYPVKAKDMNEIVVNHNIDDMYSFVVSCSHDKIKFSLLQKMEDLKYETRNPRKGLCGDRREEFAQLFAGGKSSFSEALFSRTNRRKNKAGP